MGQREGGEVERAWEDSDARKLYCSPRGSFVEGYERGKREGRENSAVLERVVRDLLLSADCAWEENDEGHDWNEACRAARAVIRECDEQKAAIRRGEGV